MAKDVRDNRTTSSTYSEMNRHKLLVPFDENFTGHGLTPKGVNSILGIKLPSFERESFDFQAIDGSVYAIDVSRCVNFELGSERNWNSFLRGAIPHQENSGDPPQFLAANAIAECVVLVRLNQNPADTLRHPDSKLHNILVTARPDGAMPANPTGTVVMRNEVTPETIDAMTRLYRIKPVPTEKCVDPPIKQEAAKSKVAPVKQTDPDVKVTPPAPGSKSNVDSRFDEAREMGQRINGNIVDNNIDTMYTNSKVAKIGVGESVLYLSDKDVTTRTERGGFGFRIGEFSEADFGSSLDVLTPLPNVNWGAEGFSFNPLLKYLPVGTIVTPYPALVQSMPTDIIQAASQITDMLSLLSGR